jgi:hypothetical protein
MSKFVSYKTNLIALLPVFDSIINLDYFEIFFLHEKDILTVKYADSLCVWHNVTQTSCLDRIKLSRRGHQCVIEDMLLY